MTKKSFSAKSGLKEGLKIISIICCLIGALFLLKSGLLFVSAALSETMPDGDCYTGAVTTVIQDGQTLYEFTPDNEGGKCVVRDPAMQAGVCQGGHCIASSEPQPPEPGECFELDCYTSPGRDASATCLYEPKEAGAACDIMGDGSMTGRCQQGADGKMWCLPQEPTEPDLEPCDSRVDLQKCVSGSSGAKAKVYRCSENKWRYAYECPNTGCEGADCSYPPSAAQNVVIQKLTCPAETCYLGEQTEIVVSISNWALRTKPYVSIFLQGRFYNQWPFWCEGGIKFEKETQTKSIIIDCDDLLGLRNMENNIEAGVMASSQSSACSLVYHPPFSPEHTENCTLKFSAAPSAPVLTHSGQPPSTVVWKWKQVKGKPTEYRIYGYDELSASGSAYGKKLLATLPAGTACQSQTPGSECSWQESFSADIPPNTLFTQFLQVCNDYGCYPENIPYGVSVEANFSYVDRVASPIEPVHKAECTDITKNSLTVKAYADSADGSFSNLEVGQSAVLLIGAGQLVYNKNSSVWTFENLKGGTNYRFQVGPSYNAVNDSSGSPLIIECATRLHSCDECGQGLFNPCDENECNEKGESLGLCYFIDGFPFNSCVDALSVPVEVIEAETEELAIGVLVKAVKPDNFSKVYSSCTTSAKGRCALSLPKLADNTAFVFLADDKNYSCEDYNCPKVLTASQLKTISTVFLRPKYIGGCFDSDYGQNWGMKGVVVLANGSRCVDYCKERVMLGDPPIVYEYYCQNGDAQITSRKCAATCYDGKCDGEIFPRKQCSQCGMPNVCTKEKCYSMGNCLFTQTTVSGGVCANSSESPPLVDLTSDLNCSLKAVDFCQEDSDASKYYPKGKNFFRKGTLQEEGIVHGCPYEPPVPAEGLIDFCDGPTKLWEYWCGGFYGNCGISANWNPYLYSCEDGCYDGACNTYGSVRVKDFFTGDPLAGAKVEARNKDNNELISSCISDLKGQCGLSLATEHINVVKVVGLSGYECNTPECPKEVLPSAIIINDGYHAHSLGLTVKPKKASEVISPGCWDSDAVAQYPDGLNFAQQGTVIDPNGSYYDECRMAYEAGSGNIRTALGVRLFEWICQGGYAQEVQYDCGTDECFEGSCGKSLTAIICSEKYTPIYQCEKDPFSAICASEKTIQRLPIDEYCLDAGQQASYCYFCEKPCLYNACPAGQLHNTEFLVFEKIGEEKKAVVGAKVSVSFADTFQEAGSCISQSYTTAHAQCFIALCPFCQYYDRGSKAGYIDSSPSYFKVENIFMHEAVLLERIAGKVKVNCPAGYQCGPVEIFRSQCGLSADIISLFKDFACVTDCRADCGPLKEDDRAAYDDCYNACVDSCHANETEQYCLDAQGMPQYTCGSCAELKCSDGTPYNSCSKVDPLKYCDNGSLVVNCVRCPACPQGTLCNTVSKQCEPEAQGTLTDFKVLYRTRTGVAKVPNIDVKVFNSSGDLAASCKDDAGFTGLCSINLPSEANYTVAVTAPGFICSECPKAFKTSGTNMTVEVFMEQDFDACQYTACPAAELREIKFRTYYEDAKKENQPVTNSLVEVFFEDTLQKAGSCTGGPASSICSIKLCPFCRYTVKGIAKGYIDYGTRRLFDTFQAPSIVNIKLTSITGKTKVSCPAGYSCSLIETARAECGSGLKSVYLGDDLNCTTDCDAQCEDLKSDNIAFYECFDQCVDDCHSTERSEYCLDSNGYPQYYCGFCPGGPEIKCSDGTALNVCSATKPLFCDNTGNFVNKCAACGCPTDQQCQTDGSCKKIEVPPTKCSDNTPLNVCSATKPLFCDNTGNFVNKCAACGCPTDQQCQTDGACLKALPVFTFSTTLYKGWNLISSPTEEPLTKNEIAQQCSVISDGFLYGSFIETGLFYSTELRPNEGGLIEIGITCTFTKKGRKPTATYNKSLRKGWNFFSVYEPATWNQIKGDCSIFTGDGSLDIYARNDAQGAYYRIGTNTTLTPFKGYRVKVTSSCILRKE